MDHERELKLACRTCWLPRFLYSVSKLPIPKQPVTGYHRSGKTYQGCHGWQGLAWILLNRKWQQQRQHAADVADTVAALPAKNWPSGSLTLFV